MVSYQLNPSYASSWSGGSIQYEQGKTFDIGAALTAGGGVFTVDETLHPTLVDALDDYVALTRSTNPNPPPPVFVDTGSPARVVISNRQPDISPQPTLWVPLDANGTPLDFSQWQVLV